MKMAPFRSLLLVLTPALIAAFTYGFSQKTHSHCSGVTGLKASIEEGLHGTGSRFLSVIQLKSDEVAPRIIQIAGTYPGLTPEDLNAPQSSPPAERGMWQYDFTDPEGPQMGTVALPPSDLVDFMVDPVCVVADNLSLGIQLNDEQTEVLVTIDRALREHQPNKFFAWQTPDNQVVIRWFEEVPAGHECLGQVMLTTIPHLEYMGSSKSGFMEADEDF